MTWNHRVVRVENKIHGDYYFIKEVYYKNNKPWMRTEDGVRVGAESIEGLRETLEWMLKALDEPILDDENDFPKVEDHQDERTDLD